MSELLSVAQSMKDEMTLDLGCDDRMCRWTVITNDLIREIEYLRSIVGAVRPVPHSSYADIAKDARHDLPVSERTDG